MNIIELAKEAGLFVANILFAATSVAGVLAIGYTIISVFNGRFLWT